MSGARCLHALARAFPQLDVRDEREVSQHGSTIERIACWGATTPRAQVRLIVIAILGSWMFLRAVGYSPARAAVLPMRAFVSATLFERFFSFHPPTRSAPPARPPATTTPPTPTPPTTSELVVRTFGDARSPAPPADPHAPPGEMTKSAL